VSRVRARRLHWSAVAAEHFPLDSLGGWFASVKEEIATGRGFVVVRGLPAAKYELEDLKRIYWGIGAHFGRPEAQSHDGDRLGDIIDLSDEQPDVFRRRGYHSAGAQLAHTDSSDIVSMLSITTAKTGGASRLASAHAVHNLMLDHCPSLLKVLYDGFYLRGTDTDAQSAGYGLLSRHRVPVYNYKDGWLNSFYVTGYIRRPVLAGMVSLSPLEEAAIGAFDAFANHPDVMLSMLLEPGDMQFLNNRTIFHGRAGFEDFREKERRRHLLRLWLVAPGWPKMSSTQDYQSAEVRRRWEERARMRAMPTPAD
jgi:Taurine catabolism dioxygenase TauD, TfdA family